MLFLTGCGTINVPMYSTATIGNSWERIGLTEFEGYSIDKFDGENVSYEDINKHKAIFHILVGEHKLIIRSVFKQSSKGYCPCPAYNELIFNAEKGKRYKLTGKVKGKTSYVWIIDVDTEERKSKVSCSNYGNLKVRKGYSSWLQYAKSRKFQNIGSSNCKIP